MAYIRNPRHCILRESDGDYRPGHGGKYKADDGTFHDSPQEVLDYERMRADRCGKRTGRTANHQDYRCTNDW
jgi:hypothetical protein